MGIVEQLVEIYEKYEDWHATRLTHEEAVAYHQEHYEKGDIYVVTKEGEVGGYYERYFDGDRCILFNVWVRPEMRGKETFKELYRHFFATMPKHITKIDGEKVKLGGKVMTALLRRR